MTRISPIISTMFIPPIISTMIPHYTNGLRNFWTLVFQLKNDILWNRLAKDGLLGEFTMAKLPRYKPCLAGKPARSFLVRLLKLQLP